MSRNKNVLIVYSVIIILGISLSAVLFFERVQVTANTQSDSDQLVSGPTHILEMEIDNQDPQVELAANSQDDATFRVIPATGEGVKIYLPLVTSKSVVNPPNPASLQPRVNVPFFQGDVRYPETAVFWFGKVNREDNFTDVRIGYNSEHLFVNLAIYDRTLWYDTSPAAADFHKWDTVRLFLDLPGTVTTQSGTQYRFDGMLNWWEESRSPFQAAYSRSQSAWAPSSVPFTTTTGWRGNGPNNNTGDDRGWVITYRIPFSSLGLSAPPATGTMWKLGIQAYDQDEGEYVQTRLKNWPDKFSIEESTTWGELHFGMPAYLPRGAVPTGQVLIRHLLNGASVPGGAVGGGTTCGDGLSFWSQWGDTSYLGSEDNSVFNIQNQSDIADWPCFSRYYLTFPLDSIPAGKSIISARMVLHLAGNSGGGEWGTPSPSYIQVFTVSGGWVVGEITWNNAPLARENIAATWVNPILQFPGWPGVPYEWDVTRGVAEAVSNGQPLRLAIYSADSQYHSGKYFVSSYTADWNQKARPALEIKWGD